MGDLSSKVYRTKETGCTGSPEMEAHGGAPKMGRFFQVMQLFNAVRQSKAQVVRVEKSKPSLRQVRLN